MEPTGVGQGEAGQMGQALRNVVDTGSGGLQSVQKEWLGESTVAL